MERIIVTGGLGFIGSNYLLKNCPIHGKNEYLNIDKESEVSTHFNVNEIQALDNYKFVKLDLCNKSDLFPVIKEFAPTRIIHFAAETHVDRSITDPHSFIESNILGTLNILEAIRHIQNSYGDRIHLHHVSTDEVYGSLQSEGSFYEYTKYDPSSPYSSSKASSDLLVQAWGRTYGIPYTISNCSNNYGPRQHSEKLIPLVIKKIRSNSKIPVYGNGKNIRDWLYVDDHCDAINAILDSGKQGTSYNIGGECELDNITLIKMICGIMSIKLGCDIEDLLSLIEYVQDRPGHDFRYAINADKIKKDCGWSPKKNVYSGLEETINWYMQNS